MDYRVKRKRKSFIKAHYKALCIIIIFIALYALSWAITVGAIKLITLCFSWKFSLLHATGIWLIICLVKGCSRAERHKVYLRAWRNWQTHEV